MAGLTPMNDRRHEPLQGCLVLLAGAVLLVVLIVILKAVI